MKNLTITVEDEIARWVKVWAARHDTSVSRLLGDLLRQYMREEEGYEAAKRSYLAERPLKLKTSGAYPGRDELHDRDSLR